MSVLPPTIDKLNAARTATSILMLSRELGANAEAAVRGALTSTRPDIMVQIGPTDPPDPGAAPGS